MSESRRWGARRPSERGSKLTSRPFSARSELEVSSLSLVLGDRSGSTGFSRRTGSKDEVRNDDRSVDHKVPILGGPEDASAITKTDFFPSVFISVCEMVESDAFCVCPAFRSRRPFCVETRHSCEWSTSRRTSRRRVSTPGSCPSTKTSTRLVVFPLGK